jgi:hypothetical protein
MGEQVIPLALAAYFQGTQKSRKSMVDDDETESVREQVENICKRKLQLVTLSTKFFVTL